MTRPQLLIVEDSAELAASLQRLLAPTYDLAIATSGSAADALMQSRTFDLVLLDWMLPDTQGILLLQRWHKLPVAPPVILLTARSETSDVVLGLEMGAQDYITKPFEPSELMARIRVQLRDGRPTAELQTPLQLGDLVLDPRKREAQWKGESITLTATEFNLLFYLAAHPLQPFSREELLKKIWGYQRAPTTRTVDTHVLSLRQKTDPALIETLHRVGYRMRPQGAIGA